jgi:hypothetical protein
VVTHFININYRVCNALIGFKRIKGGHASENITEVVIPVLEEYEISQNLGVFVVDNTDSNDTVIQVILKSLRPDLDINN